MVGDPGEAHVWADDAGRCEGENRGRYRGDEDRSCGESARRLCREMPGDDRRDAELGERSASGAECYYERSRNYRSLFGAFVGDSTWDHSIDDHRDLRRDVDAPVSVSYDLGAGPECSGRSAGLVPSATRVGWSGVAASGAGNNGFVGESSADRRWYRPVSAGRSGGRTSSSRDGTYSCETGEIRDQVSGLTDGMGRAERSPCGRRALFEEQQEGHALCTGTNCLCAGRVARRDGEGTTAVEGIRQGSAGDCEAVWCDAEGLGDQRCASVQARYGCEGAGCSSPGGGERGGGRCVGEDGVRPSRGFPDGLSLPGGVDIDSGCSQACKVPAVVTGLGTGRAMLDRSVRVPSGDPKSDVRLVNVERFYEVLESVERLGGYVMTPLGVQAPSGFQSGVGVEGRDLPPPVVETVRVADLLEDCAPGDRWILESVCSWDAFVDNVLEPGVQMRVHNARTIGVAQTRMHRMVELRYIRRIRAGSVVRFGVACAVFFVPKDEVLDRLIWNGIPLNQMCRRPPSTNFVPIHDMLRVLCRSGVVWTLAYDFATWFVQLQVEETVQRVFLVRRRDGSYWRITGIPMGFAWAPVVAQIVAETVVRVVLKEIDDERVGAFVYIDNVLFYFVGELDMEFVQRVDGVFRRVCKRFGVVLKESASVAGIKQDWLGVEIEAGKRRAKLRAKFCEKMASAWDVLKTVDEAEVIVWWRMIALVVRALWVTGQPLALVGDAMAWMARQAGALSKGVVNWSTSVRLWSLAWRQIGVVVDWVRGGAPFWVNIPQERILGYGVSDAASGVVGAKGFIARVGTFVRIVRIANVNDVHINEQEFEAACMGVTQMNNAVCGSGWLIWGSDSEVAMGWIRLGWSPSCHRNSRLRQMLMDVRGAERELKLVKVPGSGYNPADVLTRIGRSWRMEQGRSWVYDTRVVCECRGICRHVLRFVWALLEVPPVEEAVEFPDDVL